MEQPVTARGETLASPRAHPLSDTSPSSLQSSGQATTAKAMGASGLAQKNTTARNHAHARARPPRLPGHVCRTAAGCMRNPPRVTRHATPRSTQLTQRSSGTKAAEVEPGPHRSARTGGVPERRRLGSSLPTREECVRPLTPKALLGRRCGPTPGSHAQRFQRCWWQW